MCEYPVWGTSPSDLGSQSVSPCALEGQGLHFCCSLSRLEHWAKLLNVLRSCWVRPAGLSQSCMLAVLTQSKAAVALYNSVAQEGDYCHTRTAHTSLSSPHHPPKTPTVQEQQLCRLYRSNVVSLLVSCDPSTVSFGSGFVLGGLGLCVESSSPDHISLQTCLNQQDEVIGQEMEATNQTGGCTALAALYFQGKLYVANAGDSR